MLPNLCENVSRLGIHDENGTCLKIELRSSHSDFCSVGFTLLCKGFDEQVCVCTWGLRWLNSCVDRHNDVPQSALLNHIQRDSCQSLNCPEENDETMSNNGVEDSLSDSHPSPPLIHHSPFPDAHNPPADRRSLRNDPPLSRQGGLADLCSSMNSSWSCSHHQRSYNPYQPPLGLPAGYSPPTPFPSQTEVCLSTLDPRKDAWLPPSLASGTSVGGYLSGSLPSCLVSGDYLSYPGEDCYSRRESLSLPGCRSPSVGSLEQPRSLHSLPAPAALHSYYLYPCPSRGAACYGPCPGDAYRVEPMAHHRPGYHMPYWPSHPESSRPPDAAFIQSSHAPPHPGPKSGPSTASLSLEQRKVFVTYEADSDRHVKEVINFVALLRHNGFYTHIDMFEQQFRSISKIDFMERYISEKDYLIIIAISPKYHETVTNTSFCMDDDETLNTVYIHKQLQNEFIQNGCRNFRFIPILFPGAKKCHVPTWLQNTHVYSWPRNRDDILRRLMRVEKYNPPPIGELPTIVSIPI